MATHSRFPPKDQRGDKAPPGLVAIPADGERVCGRGRDTVRTTSGTTDGSEQLPWFLQTPRLRRFTEIWVEELRRQMVGGQDSPPS